MVHSNHNLWLKHKKKILAFRFIKSDDKLYNYLLNHGVNKLLLDDFISSDRSTKKRIGAKIPSSKIIKSDTLKLLEIGGHIAGGSILKTLLDIPNNKDIDVFFNDFTNFVKAFLATYDNPVLDICFYENKPYELFDFGISKISYSQKTGLDISKSCQIAFVSGVSDIIFENIINPTATLDRIIKYGKKYSIKFDQSQVLFLIATHNIKDEKLIKEALSMTIS